MGNPYLEHVTARMKADDAHKLLWRHWSSRAWWLIQRMAHRLEHWGLERTANAYLVGMGPVCDWLAHRQSVFLRRWL
jgi:hypothetical protein